VNSTSSPPILSLVLFAPPVLPQTITHSTSRRGRPPSREAGRRKRRRRRRRWRRRRRRSGKGSKVAGGWRRIR
jgi:hypothetical protein